MSKGRAITVVMADDDEDDRMLAKEAWDEAMLSNGLDFVEDGQDLMDYLRCRCRHAGREGSPLPGLILLDLNMPRKDGREALGEIKADPRLRGIPVVVLTTSRAEEDILRSYDIGASAFIVKPVSFEALVDVMKTLRKYWFEIVEFPPERTQT
jgi:CheY-like chemotaxis protein